MKTKVSKYDTERDQVTINIGDNLTGLTLIVSFDPSWQVGEICKIERFSREDDGTPLYVNEEWLKLQEHYRKQAAAIEESLVVTLFGPNSFRTK